MKKGSVVKKASHGIGIVRELGAHICVGIKVLGAGWGTLWMICHIHMCGIDGWAGLEL